jgi:hypothetical protein
MSIFSNRTYRPETHRNLVQGLSHSITMKESIFLKTAQIWGIEDV